MATLIERTSRIAPADNKPKLTDEYVGQVNTGNTKVSTARMQSPQGWEEPGQTPQFDEYTVVLRGELKVTTHEGSFDVKAGQAVWAPAAEWVRYGTPDEPAEYITVCIPAFWPDTVHRG